MKFFEFFVPSLCLGIVSLLIAVPTATATVRYVAQYNQTPDSSAVPSYTSWDTAASNIQEVASVCADGDIIYVGPGEYRAEPDSTTIADIACSLSLIAALPPGADQGSPVLNGEGRARCLYVRKGPFLIDGFVVTNGFSSASGGGMRLAAESVPVEFKNCTFTHNSATDDGGGIYYNSISDRVEMQWTLSNCVIRSNSAGGDGGGMFRRSGENSTSSIEMFDCLIEDNEAQGSGGGLYQRGGTIRTENCHILRNLSRGTTVNHGGGAIFYQDTSQAASVNCLFAQNQARTGSVAFRMTNSAGTDNFTWEWLSCTMVNNSGGQAIAFRREMKNNVSSFQMYNTIIHASGNVGHSSITFTNIVFSHACHDINLPEGPGNLQENPQFMSENEGDYRLKSISPCLNAGTNQLWMVGARDLAGRPRIDRVSGLVDIGCYEYSPAGGVTIIR